MFGGMELNISPVDATFLCTPDFLQCKLSVKFLHFFIYIVRIYSKKFKLTLNFSILQPPSDAFKKRNIILTFFPLIFQSRE